MLALIGLFYKPYLIYLNLDFDLKWPVHVTIYLFKIPRACGLKLGNNKDSSP